MKQEENTKSQLREKKKPQQKNPPIFLQDFHQSENKIKMEFLSIPKSSSDLNLSLAPPLTQETSHENVVFPYSNFHTGSTFVQAVSMHNEILSSMHLHNEMARRFDKTAVEETHFLNARSAALVANLRLRLLARNQECASLKAEVAELQKLLKQSN